MRYLPLNLDIRGRKAVVAGGGPVACRKVALLLEAGALVTVIAPDVHERLKELAAQGGLTLVERDYSPDDLAGAVLAFAATNDRSRNAAIAAEARSRGIEVNVVDDPDAGTFTLPATLVRGELMVTVSTGGRCPALAAGIRRELEDRFGNEYALVVRIMGAVREKLLTEKHGTAYNKSLLDELASCDLPHLVAHGAFTEIDSLLLELFGPGYTLGELGVREKDSA